LLGKHVNSAKLMRIRNAAEHTSVINVALDADTAIGEAYNVVREIGQAVPWCTVRRYPIPGRYKDPGEIPMAQLRNWATSTIH
jgi:hypothetical protein